MAERVVFPSEKAWKRIVEATRWTRNFRASIPGGQFTNEPDRCTLVIPPGGQRASQGKVYRPLYAKVTAIHDNYVKAKLYSLVNTAAPGATATAYEYQILTDAVEVNVALHPELQKYWYDAKAVPDPLDTGTTWTPSYVGPQQRQNTDGTTTYDQRIQPWYSTNDNAAPIVIDRASLIVKDDDGTTDIECGWIDARPRAWANWTLPA